MHDLNEMKADAEIIKGWLKRYAESEDETADFLDEIEGVDSVEVDEKGIAVSIIRPGEGMTGYTVALAGAVLNALCEVDGLYEVKVDYSLHHGNEVVGAVVLLTPYEKTW